MKRERQIDGERLKALALDLGMPGVKTTSWGQPTLKAHGKTAVRWPRARSRAR